eukprot:scaffold5153_cov69-Isochrysis_galbana.AAC.3
MRFSVLCRRRLRSRDTRFRLLYYLRMSCCRRLRLSRRLRCYNRLRRRLCLNRRNSRLRLLCSLVLRRLQLALVPALRLGGAGVRAGAVGAERLRQLGLVGGGVSAVEGNALRPAPLPPPRNPGQRARGQYGGVARERGVNGLEV